MKGRGEKLYGSASSFRGFIGVKTTNPFRCVNVSYVDSYVRMIMVLPLTCVVSMKFQLVGKQLREISSSWFRRVRPRAEAAPAAPTHATTGTALAAVRGM